MRETTVKVYTFSELSESSKQRAKDAHAEACGYSWADEAMESIKALAAHFDGEMKDWSIDWFDGSYSDAKFQMPDADDIGNNNLPDDIQRAIGYSEATDADVKAAYEKWLASKLSELGTFNPDTLKGQGDCKLTGFCMDEGAIDGFRIAFHAGERDLGELMMAAFRSWLKEAQSDCEWQYKDEAFGEMCDANDYEFYESGELV